MSREPADAYQRAGADLDDHIENCPLCRNGTGCPDGDNAAEAEYRAWRRWQDTNPTHTRQNGGRA